MTDREKRIIREYIERNYPQHLNGFDNGWLGFHYIDEFNGGYHIFANCDSSPELIGTVLF